MKNRQKFEKPSQFIEREIVKSIVSEQWKAGQTLPPERKLADILGVTRPTLREVLKGLAEAGWLTIRHGKPTIVKDYKISGGLGVLKTLIKYDAFSSEKLITDWLEFRILIFPHLASKAISENSEVILKKLNEAPQISTAGSEFAVFDWELQLLLIQYSQNSIALMLYNDLSEIYFKEGSEYFKNSKLKQKSIDYYEKLKNAVVNSKETENIIRTSMQESYEIRKNLKSYNQ
ncbi:MAG: GntR family transcriptional regulator [Bacteroidota bacterium]|nr:GntR family transcriptional regulator [Bacteroidota bacterium]